MFELDVVIVECLHHLVMTDPASFAAANAISSSSHSSSASAAALLSRSKPVALLHHLSWYDLGLAGTTFFYVVLRHDTTSEHEWKRSVSLVEHD